MSSTVNDPTSKATLVYGITDENLVLLPEEVALAVASDLAEIGLLKTYGEARRFEPKFLWVPGLDEDDPEDQPDDDDPYDAGATNECENGDWPPAAATIALDVFDDELEDIGEQREHFPGSPTLFIDPSSEDSTVQELRRRGYEVRRDDELMRRSGA